MSSQSPLGRPARIDEPPSNFLGRWRKRRAVCRASFASATTFAFSLFSSLKKPVIPTEVAEMLGGIYAANFRTGGIGRIASVRITLIQKSNFGDQEFDFDKCTDFT